MVIDIEHQREMNRQRQKRYRDTHKSLRNVTDNVTKSVTNNVTDNVTDNDFERKTLRNVTHNVTGNKPTVKVISIKPAEPKLYVPDTKNCPKPEPVKEPSFFDFVFGKKEYSDFKTNRKLALKEKRSETTSIFSWVNSFLGFGD